MPAAPVSYRIGDEQYLLFAGGRPGQLGLGAPTRSASATAQGPARLFAFKLGGKAEMPAARRGVLPVPEPPARTASAEQVKRGSDLWQDQGCGICHGSNVIGIGERRLDGFIPDLRYMPPAVHQEWPAVVLGGTRRLRGMPGFAGRGLSPEDSEALHAYVIDAAWKAYEAQQEAPETSSGEEGGAAR